MPLPLQCSCGARLEVDDKFAGQTISCPDCGRPLTAPLPPKPAATTSGLALASLLLALIGAFTLVGTLTAMVCGFLALRVIRRSPEPLGGKILAQAGLIAGGVFTLLTVAGFFFLDRLGLDGFLRSLDMAGKIVYDKNEKVAHSASATGNNFSIELPNAAWGKLVSSSSTQAGRENLQEVALFNVWLDAQIVCLSDWKDRKLPLEACREEGTAMFKNSRLVKLLAHLSESASAPAVGEPRELRQLGDSEIQEFYLDMRLGGIERTFLVRVLRDKSTIGVVAGGARKTRFAKLEKQLREGIESFKWEK
ncbi:MAG: DUF4190 domain-containing protein [Planctomycetes bacterium]|nr:DUF4190 domain-containing protein [Planctomycetota bacterium]